MKCKPEQSRKITAIKKRIAAVNKRNEQAFINQFVMPGVPHVNTKPKGLSQKSKSKKMQVQQNTMPNDWSRMGSKGMDFLRQWVNNQKKSQGSRIVTSVGTQVTQDLNIQQQGKFLLGFGFAADKTGFGVPQGLVNILVNNEKFITDLEGTFLDVSLIEEEFYFYPRPLTGIDKITIQITDSIAQTAIFAAYYI